MATIALTSNNNKNNNNNNNKNNNNSRLTLPQEHNHEIVFALYSWGKKSKRVAGTRDTIDILLDILKNALKYSKPSAIRHSTKISTKRNRRYIAILCHFGLLSEMSITRRCGDKNELTGRREMQTIRRYYVTPKGHALIRIYNTVVDLLIPFI